jgi:hypothetical protein
MAPGRNHPTRGGRPYAQKMRFVQPAVLVLGAAMYIAFAEFARNYDENSSPSGPDNIQLIAIVAGWILVLLLAAIVATINAVRRVRARKTQQLAVDALLVKLASIPFFLINFAALMFVFVIGTALFFGAFPLVWTVVGVGIGLTYLTMLSSSIPTWATIGQLRRERVIGTGLTVLYAILSLIFVTDIAASVLLFGHSRRRPRLALVWLFLSFGFATIAVGILVFTFARWWGYSDISWLVWGMPAAIGIAVILFTAIVSVMRRSSLRIETQAARAARASTESVASDQVPVG